MPTYDYECQACEHRFELFQSMAAKVKRKCPECGKLKLKRLIGPGAGFLFKGDGFYITDYRSESYKEGESAAKKSSQNGSDSGSGSGKSGEAAKSTTKTSDKSGDGSSSSSGKADSAGQSEKSTAKKKS